MNEDIGADPMKDLRTHDDKDCFAEKRRHLVYVVGLFTSELTTDPKKKCVSLYMEPPTPSTPKTPKIRHFNLKSLQRSPVAREIAAPPASVYLSAVPPRRVSESPQSSISSMTEANMGYRPLDFSLATPETTLTTPSEKMERYRDLDEKLTSIFLKLRTEIEKTVQQKARELYMGIDRTVQEKAIELYYELNDAMGVAGIMKPRMGGKSRRRRARRGTRRNR